MEILSRRLSGLLLLGALSAGCGIGFTDGPTGGGEDLPISGAGPYGKPELDLNTPADEPFVVTPRRSNFYDPSALHRADGGFRLWFGRRLDNQDDQSEIWRTGLASITELPDSAPERVLAADQPWEQGFVGAPSVIQLSDETLVMFYRGGTDQPSIGRADSTDGGANWRKFPGNPVLRGAASPGAVPPIAALGGGWWLYVTTPASPGIFRATSTNGDMFVLDPLPVLLPRTTQPDAFDSSAVLAPSVVARVLRGRAHLGLFFNGIDAEGDISIGYAGSFDGVTWERFNGLEPILTAGNPAESGPSAVVDSARAFLFYDQRSSGQQSIGVAIAP